MKLGLGLGFSQGGASKVPFSTLLLGRGLAGTVRSGAQPAGAYA